MEVWSYRQVQPHAKFLGLACLSCLDIDEQSMSYARRNILQNKLKSRVRPLLSKVNDPLISLDTLGLER